MNLTSLRSLVLGALAPWLVACPSTSTMTLARTMPAGKVQALLSPGVVVSTAPASVRQGTVMSLPPELPLPQLEVGARYAITDHVEVGAKVWAIGAAIDTKVALVRPESDEHGFNLSLDPALTYFGGGTTTGQSFNLYLPLLMGVRLSHHELVIAPRVVGMWRHQDDGTSSVSVWAGGSFGFAARGMPGFRFMPEVSYLKPIAQFGAGSPAASGGTEHLVQFGLGALVGGD